MIFKNAKIVLEERVINQGWIEINADKIVAFGEGEPTKPATDLNEQWILPGFIDCHVHGGYGVDFESGDENRFDHFSKNVVSEGVTSYIQGSVTNSVANNLKYMQSFSKFMSTKTFSGAKCLGVHFEGPFISSERKGAHELELLQKPTVEAIQTLLTGNEGLIKTVTYAPELDNGDFTRFLLANNILPSAGHSNILFKDFVKFHQIGVKHITHLYNGMSGVSQRDPGLAAAGLYFDKILCELITDGIHVDPDMIRLTYKIKGYQGICIITDAMNAKGLPDGEYKLGNLHVIKEGIKVALADSGTLAGAGATFDHNVRMMLNYVSDLKMNELIHMTSINVAKQFQIFDKTGSIAVGKQADLVILNQDLEVVKTMVDGIILFNAEEEK